MEVVIDKLKAIHDQVKEHFEYKTDLEQHGELERWSMPSGSLKLVGDCEDFALKCRMLCREQGLKTRLVVCYDENGDGHCVLECLGFILDNRQRKVVANTSLNYEWLYISGFEPGDDWHKID